MPESILKGNTLLVVENEAALGELEMKSLGSSGYAGCRRLDASPRPCQWLRRRRPIHRLLTDFSLPDRNGFDLAHCFRQLQPETAIIMVSGSVMELDGKAEGFSLFPVETPVPLRDTAENENGIPLIINNLLLFSG